jgi:hypothetical protein
VVLVDEYQDCLVDQHALVVAIANAVPTAVLGDPLQGLFSFAQNVPVVWETDVLANFPHVDVAYRPRRWEPHHQELGEWLIAIRDDLKEGRPIDFSGAPVTWVQRADPRTYVRVCFGALKLDGSIAVLGQFRPDCVNAASNLQGTYTVMEAIDEKIPARLAVVIDTKGRAETAKAVVEFAMKACSGLAIHIPKAKRTRLGGDQSFTTTKDELKAAYAAILEMRSDPTMANVYAALGEIARLPGKAGESVAVAGQADPNAAEHALRLRAASRCRIAKPGRGHLPAAPD